MKLTMIDGMVELNYELKEMRWNMNNEVNVAIVA